MLTVRERGVKLRIERPTSRKSIALDTRYLYQTADRVAGHAQMVLQSHLGGILYLRRTTSEKLTRSRAGHSTSHTNLTLAAYLCSRYRRRSEEHTSELQSRQYLVCRLLLEKKK